MKKKILLEFIFYFIGFLAFWLFGFLAFWLFGFVMCSVRLFSFFIIKNKNKYFFFS